tara:strand:+ start:141 stop:566 length:426 start_codon:yes stop_codon:yes gene_type:complete
MAPIGGGPPVGSTGGTFTGTAEALEVAGDFAYAYSGVVAVGSAGIGVPSTLLKFTTGNYLFVGTFQYFRGVPSNQGHDYIQKLKLNGTTVIEVDDTASTTFEHDSPLIIIPPYTEVEATSQNATSGADNNIDFTITGRIYR